ncbi:polysaccharide lyase family 1 protein [Parabacteroides sp. FAFU027]|uniref:pectate lyase family protein n=1 Tax=Parabacteroides sp. FAFU027 TaxID=2922715 RepID=UPI001FAF3D70|nr:pectate lyase [Parabacteroides sp. FAFU027]
MKSSILLTTLGFLSSLFINAQTLAFPGAEGFGRFAEGGRNGEVYYVTNLNNTGTGSFRDAVSQPNRTILFKVGGVIHIKERIAVKPNITIAGQTAPGEGVTIYGNSVSFTGADNTICRYIRFRMGKNGTHGKDAAALAEGKNMIFDHISVSWGLDENFSISGKDPQNITIQNSIIGQGLLPHSCGGLIQTKGGVTIFRNLYIDNHTRNPKVKGLNQFVNNVIYNWGKGGGYILGGESEGRTDAMICNNYFIAGPSTGVPPFSRGNENFHLFARNNFFDKNRNDKLDGILVADSAYGKVSWEIQPLSTIPSVTMYQPEENCNWIADNAGASFPQRDNIDRMLIEQLISLGKEGKTIANETENPVQVLVNASPVFSKIKDSDGDGMPDVWEKAHKLNPKDSKDGKSHSLQNDYSNLEVYLNELVATKVNLQK